jgi:hypothetical protein
MSDPNEIVGHKTFDDGHGGFRHEPLPRAEADALLRHVEAESARRLALMPDEETARKMLFDAYIRLKECGWNDACYCPKDGRTFDVIEVGSSGVHKAHYEGEWPKGSYWVQADHDLYPSRPVLFRNNQEPRHD